MLRIFLRIIFALIFAQIRAEWEIPDELRPPQFLTVIKNGFQSAVYFTENGQNFVDEATTNQQWLFQRLLEFADENKMPKMAKRKGGANLEGNGIYREHTVSSNWHTIIDKINGKSGGVLDGCEVLLQSSERIDFEIGVGNVTIGCINKNFNLSLSQLNVYFCKNGTECQRSKKKLTNCAIILQPAEGNWTNYDQQQEKSRDNVQFYCNGSISPILLHLRPFEENKPDLRESFYQKRGRFHCPSEVTCLYEMFFNPNFDGQNAMEMANLAINFTIFFFLFFLNDCKLKLGN
ncbi:hypothetical protein niasHS_004051 [Heterodera schachtii]|uniref:Uncharacterized protein n=1 Tax=Heterodera schachtii TaxID=97005 RepID=A0ABD2JUH0_HETSC